MDIEKVKEFLLKNLVTMVSIFISCLSIIGSITFVLLTRVDCPICDDCEEVAFMADDELKEEIEKTEVISVDIKGAVKKPGVYTFSESATVNDVIDIAGGLNSAGTTENINLSKKIKDEMVIYIFTKSELQERETKNEIACNIPTCECEVIEINQTLESDKDANSNGSSESTNKKISINTATLEELMRLDGIGESKAKSIIEYRETNGKFETIEDIKKVSGIGDSAFEKIKDYITL